MFVSCRVIKKVLADVKKKISLKENVIACTVNNILLVQPFFTEIMINLIISNMFVLFETVEVHLEKKSHV